MRIVAVVGSLGADSSNLKLLRRAVALAPAGIEVLLFDRLGTLPFFDPDVPWVKAPAAVMDLRSSIQASDAVMIAAPEYGHSLPGVLKNAIDWLIGSGELESKIVAITASVPHRDRGRMGLAALKQTLGAMKVQLVSDATVVRGADADAALKKILSDLADAVTQARDL